MAREFNIGDKLKSDNVIRQIIAVRDTGYSWIYPNIPDKEFMSEDSNDPFFVRNWKKI